MYISYIQLHNFNGISLDYPKSNRKEKWVKTKHILPEVGIIIMFLLFNQAFLCGDGFEDNERIVFE